jgi:glycosyltransferase involved in cell wall biosynthesis
MMVNNEIKISVALTTYNGEKYLRKQLDSIFAQTLKPSEVIVCDDCSSDNTVEILEEYNSKYNLKYQVNAQRLGYIKNFEKAIGLCTEDLIALSDQDDIWLADKLEKLALNINENLLIFSNASLINAEDELLNGDLISDINNVELSASVLNYIFQPFVTGCTVLIRTSLYQHSIPFPEHVPHDFWLAVKAKSLGKLTYCNEKLILYRQHEANSIGISPKSKIINFKKLFNKNQKASRLKYFSEELALLESVYKNIKLDKLAEEVLKSKIDFIRSHVNKSFNYSALISRLKYHKFYHTGKLASVKEVIHYIKDTLL